MRLGTFTTGSHRPCERCGLPHTYRQRCPLDPAPAPAHPLGGEELAAARAKLARFEHGGAAPWSVIAAVLAANATVVLVAALIAAGVSIAMLTQAGADVARASAVLAISVAAGFVLGAGLMFVTKRAYAKVVLSLLSVVLITAGVVMLVYAPVLRQMDSPDIAEYTAFDVLLLSGAASLAAGILLATLCVRWALRPHALRTLQRWSRLLGSAYGVMQGMAGMFGVLALFALANASSDGFESVAVRAISLTVIAAMSLTSGLMLTWHGINASMGEPSSEFRLPEAAWFIAALAAVLVGGGLLMRADPPVAAPMPLLHVAAAALPGVALLAMINRGGVLRGSPVRWLTWRRVMLAMAISMTVGGWIALYVESVGGFAAVVLLLVHNGAFKYALDMADVNDAIGEASSILSRNEQYVANLVTAALVAPLAEEFAKGLGVRFMMLRNTTRAQAFLLGAAAGAAFGFIEALLYGVAGVQQDEGGWWLIMLVRSGSTSLHVFNTALVGLAWWYWSIGGRPRVALALFGGAVLSHATWNALAVTFYSRIFGLDTLSDRAIEGLAYAVSGAIAVAFVVALPLIARRLREPAPAPVAGTPLATMAPWLG